MPPSSLAALAVPAPPKIIDAQQHLRSNPSTTSPKHLVLPHPAAFELCHIARVQLPRSSQGSPSPAARVVAAQSRRHCIGSSLTFLYMAIASFQRFTCLYVSPRHWQQTRHRCSQGKQRNMVSMDGGQGFFFDERDGRRYCQRKETEGIGQTEVTEGGRERETRPAIRNAAPWEPLRAMG